MKIKSITFITIILALIFVCSPIVAAAANSSNSLGVHVVSGEYQEKDKDIVIRWTEDPNATSYRIYRSKSSTGEKRYLAQTLVQTCFGLFFGTSINYDEALDAANVMFAKKMMDEAWWGKAASELLR